MGGPAGRSMRELDVNGKGTALNAFKHEWTSIGEGRLLGDMFMCAGHHSASSDKISLLKHKALNSPGCTHSCY